MANFTETLEMFLKADASQGISEIKRFADATEKSVGQAESTIKRLSSGALKLGGGGMALGGFLTAMSDADKQSLEGLKASISAAGESYGEFEGKVDGAIGKMAKFGHTDGEVTQSLSILVSSFGSTQAALDHMQLTADLAAQKHISLAAAAELVAKAHGGAGRIFKEFNIQVQTNADGTKNYDGALDQLSGKLNGQASASVVGFTGWLKVQGAQLENAVSALGEKYGPAILGVSTALTALGGITSAVTAIQERHAAAAAEEAAATNLSKGAMAGLAVGLLAVGAAYAYGKSNAEQFTVALEKMTNAQIDQYLQKIVAAANLAGGGFEKYAESLPVDQQVRLADAMDRAGMSSEKLRGNIANQKQASDEAAGANDTLTGSTKDLTKATYDYVTAMKAVDTERNKSLDGVAGLQAATVGLTDAQIAARDKIDALSKAQKDGKLSADEQTKALDDAKSSILSQVTAAGDLAEKQATMAGNTDTATARQQAMVTELGNVMNALDPNSPLRKFLQDYTLELLAVPTSRQTTFSIITQGGNAVGANIGGGRIAAASGYTGWVKGPQEFLVGEAGEDEYVSITPKSKMQGWNDPSNKSRLDAAARKAGYDTIEAFMAAHQPQVSLPGAAGGRDVQQIEAILAAAGHTIAQNVEVHIHGAVIGNTLERAAEDIRRALLKKSGRNPAAFLGLT